MLALWHVFAVSGLFGFVNAFFAPAYAALISHVIPVRLLPSANALTTPGAEINGVVGCRGVGSTGTVEIPRVDVLYRLDDRRCTHRDAWRGERHHVLDGLRCALGMVLSFSNLLWTGLPQEKIAGEMFGRVSSINSLDVTGLLPIGCVLVGLVLPSIQQLD